MQRADAGGRTVAQSIVDAAAAVNRDRARARFDRRRRRRHARPTRPTSARSGSGPGARRRVRRADVPKRSAGSAGPARPTAARRVARGAARRTRRRRAAGRSGEDPRRRGVPGMSAYDIAAWTDFANTVAGGAAALAGLLFVGLSLNLSEVLEYPGVPSRAAATLGLTVAILLIADLRRHARAGAWQALSIEIARDWHGDGRNGCGGRYAPTASRPAPGDGADVAVDAAACLRRCCWSRRVSLWCAARRRLVLGNRGCGNGFRVCDRERVGAGRRAQALASASIRRISSTALATPETPISASRISPVMSPRSRVR